MLKSSLAAIALTCLFALPSIGCTTTYVVQDDRGHRARAGGVPFNGFYTKFAEGTFKNGRRVRVANSNGSATVRIEHGKVVYDQTYVSHGDIKRVIQIYSFRGSDVQPIGGGDYEVNLTFRHITGDTSGYSPDRNNPKLEARRVPGGSGWEIALFTTDNNGVVGIVELQ